MKALANWYLGQHEATLVDGKPDLPGLEPGVGWAAEQLALANAPPGVPPQPEAAPPLPAAPAQVPQDGAHPQGAPGLLAPGVQDLTDTVGQLQEQVRRLTDTVGQLQAQVERLIANTEQGGELHTEVQACLRRTVDLRDAAWARDNRLTDLEAEAGDFERRLNILEGWRDEWQ